MRIRCADQTVELQPDGVTAGGTIALPEGHPSVFLTVTWDAGDSDVPRFTKLTLEPAGHPTLTRTFDGFGGIDDVWELHLHP